MKCWSCLWGLSNDMPFSGCDQNTRLWELFPGAILTTSSLCGIIGMGVVSFRFACSQGRFVQFITIFQLLGFSVIVSRSAALHIPMQVSPVIAVAWGSSGSPVCWAQGVRALGRSAVDWGQRESGGDGEAWRHLQRPSPPLCDDKYFFLQAETSLPALLSPKLGFFYLV